MFYNFFKINWFQISSTNTKIRLCQSTIPPNIPWLCSWMWPKTATLCADVTKVCHERPSAVITHSFAFNDLKYIRFFMNISTVVVVVLVVTLIATIIVVMVVECLSDCFCKHNRVLVILKSTYSMFVQLSVGRSSLQSNDWSFSP